MRGREKYAIYSILLVFVTLFQVNQSIEMMPMCQTCATDDGSSCIVCGTCQTYAVLVSGKFFYYVKVTVNVIVGIILIKMIQVKYIVIVVIQVVKNVLVH